MVFVDINMPKINGLDALEICVRKSSETTWCILTGYSEFEYAKRSISLGVKDVYKRQIYNLEGWIGTDFLRRLKPKYDGLRLLSGYPGNHVAMLRWVKKTEEYVIGCICNQQRTQRLSLDFLPEGEFEAEIYTDDRFGDEIL